jgi:translation initiation factor 1 (eIF-1/SUI1)
MKGKTITMIENLDDDIDMNIVMKAMRKSFETGGAIMKDTRTGLNFIKLNGDFRRQSKQFLIENQVIEGEENIARIKIHGA